MINQTEHQPLIDTSNDDTTSLYSGQVIQLLVGGQMFTVHQKALITQSKVFKRDIKKLKNEQQLEILDVEPVVFEKLLSYLYQRNVDKETLDQFAVQLWMVANKVSHQLYRSIL